MISGLAVLIEIAHRELRAHVLQARACGRRRRAARAPRARGRPTPRRARRAGDEARRREGVVLAADVAATARDRRQRKGPPGP